MNRRPSDSTPTKHRPDAASTHPRRSALQASPEGAAAERHYADLLSSGVKEAQLFFCLQEDITQTSQAASDAAASSLSAASGTPARSTAAAASAAGHGCGEPRFLWNGHIAAPLWEAGAGRFTLPLVCGFVGCVAINGGRAAGSEVRSGGEIDAAAPLCSRPILDGLLCPSDFSTPRGICQLCSRQFPLRSSPS